MSVSFVFAYCMFTPLQSVINRKASFSCHYMYMGIWKTFSTRPLPLMSDSEMVITFHFKWLLTLYKTF